jgi:hypothetical protein
MDPDRLMRKVRLLQRQWTIPWVSVRGPDDSGETAKHRAAESTTLRSRDHRIYIHGFRKSSLVNIYRFRFKPRKLCVYRKPP